MNLAVDHYDLHLDLGYYQFFLSDSRAELRSIDPDCWVDAAASHIGVITFPGIILFRAEHPSFASLSIDILNSPPSDEFIQWEKVIDASINLSSGELNVDDFPFEQNHTKLISLPPGWYRVRLSYSYSPNELDGKFYFYIWQAPKSELHVRLLKGEE